MKISTHQQNQQRNETSRQYQCRFRTLLHSFRLMCGCRRTTIRLPSTRVTTMISPASINSPSDTTSTRLTFDLGDACRSQRRDRGAAFSEPAAGRSSGAAANPAPRASPVSRISRRPERQARQKAQKDETRDQRQQQREDDAPGGFEDEFPCRSAADEAQAETCE